MAKKCPKKIGKLSRTKGRAFEQEIARLFRPIFPDARRHLEYQQFEAAFGADLAGTGPYQIQCKRGRKWASLSAIEEVKADEAFGEVPVLVTKGDNKRILVALPLEHFLDILKRAHVRIYSVKEPPSVDIDKLLDELA